MTEEAIKKLPEQCKHYCETMKDIITQDIEKGNQEHRRVSHRNPISKIFHCHFNVDCDTMQAVKS
jgi:hypothetical protein